MQISTRLLEKGLVGWWKFDEPVATHNSRMLDSSGWGNHGTLSTGDALNKSVAGKLGKAVKLDGSNDYVSASAIFGLTSVHTVSVWIKPSTVANGNYYIIDKGGNNNWIQLYDGDSDGKLELRTGSSVPGGYISHSNFEFTQANIWSHIVVTLDSAKLITIYVNGVFDKSQTLTAVQTPGAISIGRLGGGNYNFSGIIDDVRIYNRALSAGEVRELFIDREQRFYTPPKYSYYHELQAYIQSSLLLEGVQKQYLLSSLSLEHVALAHLLSGLDLEEWALANITSSLSIENYVKEFIQCSLDLVGEIMRLNITITKRKDNITITKRKDNITITKRKDNISIQ